MKIRDIDATLQAAKDDAIVDVGAPREAAEAISLVDPPEPEMGDRGFPCFALARHLRRDPGSIAEEVADALRDRLSDLPLIEEVRTDGPYVNMRFARGRVAELVIGQVLEESRAFGADWVDDPERWMIEFSAPNTNKPQHLGHARNDLLGDSVARILGFSGHEVIRVNLINDRGIHICKSMLAYQMWGDGETPESAGVKGDHLVGKYYVMFQKRFAEEYAAWLEGDVAREAFEEWLDSPASDRAQKEHGADRDALFDAFVEHYEDRYFNTDSELGARARTMLQRWEAGHEDTVALWRTMNSWVFQGFDVTYERLGVGFDKVYYESNTYRLGKDVVEAGLEAGDFRRLDDGAVVCDLDTIGVGEGQKILLRSDGTSVYMTQDLGTAVARFDEFDMDRMIYVVGDEQDYHFQVLFGILEELYPDYEGRLFHLSYGMVELPAGKMKSREGEVVDADDLMDGLEEMARAETRERFPDLDDEELAHRVPVIGLAALKYYILDFNPRTTVHFDPAKSLDPQGRTGPYLLYTYARSRSILRKVDPGAPSDDDAVVEGLRALGTERERAVIDALRGWPRTLEVATRDLDPSKIAAWLFRLASAFNALYNDDDHRIIDLDTGARRDGLLLLTDAVGHALAAGMHLLGIEALEEM
jgi:arginyl-tRNA synthetase